MMWEEYVQVQLIFGIISVVVGAVVVGINVKRHHLLRTVYKGFRIVNGFSIVILVIIKLFNLLQVCTYLQRCRSRGGKGDYCPPPSFWKTSEPYSKQWVRLIKGL